MAAQSRLQTALDEGLALPEGQIAVWRPDIGFDLAALGCAPRIVTRFAPDFERFKAAGYDVSETLDVADTVVIKVPRSKAQARAMIAAAAETANLVIVDGSRTDGIDSHWKAVRKELGDVAGLAKDHGRIFWFAGTGKLAHWAETDPKTGAHGYFTRPGVFSDGTIDKGSAVLGEALPAALPGRVADLGAGWGYLAEQVLKREGVAHVALVEAEGLALDCARLNVTDSRAAFHWADATTWTGDVPFDHIVMNPPFHEGRKGAPDLGRAFIRAAARNLTPKGHLWMVANRHLPYEDTLRDTFQTGQELHGTSGFKIFHASRPKR